MFLLKKPLSIMAAMALILLLPSFEASALGGRNSEIGSSGSAGSGYFGLRGVGGKEVDFRVSLLPTTHGQKMHST